MKVSLSIVMDQLNIFNQSSMNKFSDISSFKGVQIFESNNGTYDPEYIHINLANDPIDLSQDIGDITLISNKGLITNGDLAFERKLTIIEFDEYTSMVRLFNHLQKYFIFLNEWDMKMNTHIRNMEDVEILLDESMAVLKNPVIILDLAFNVIANSDNFPEDNEFLSQVLTRGCLSKETIEGLLKKKFFENNYRNIEKFEPPNLSNTVHYIKSLFYKDKKIASVVYYCTNCQASQGQLDFIQLFSQYIEELFRRKFLDVIPCSNGFDLFFKELISNRELSEKDIIRYAKIVDLEYSSRYCIGIIRLEDSSVRCLKYVINGIRTRNPFYYVSSFENKIIVLFDMKRDKGYEKKIEGRMSWMENYLSTYKGAMGVSSIFFSLSDFLNEYKKALAALEIGCKFNPEGIIHKYKDHQIHHMFTSISKEIDLEALCYKKLKKLIEYDKLNNIDNADVLRIYLENDRSVSKTAAKKNLHRNSIIYRIKQIEEILEIDLDNFNERMRLILSYYAMDVMKSMKTDQKKINVV